MKYTKKDFAEDVLREIGNGFDVVRLARWAMRLYSCRIRDLDAGVKEAIMDVVVMAEGPEFEMTERELREFAERLMA